MRRNTPLLVSVALVTAVVLAIPGETEATILRRRGLRRWAACCCPPPCVLICQPTVPAPLPPGTRTIRSPKGVTYRLIPSGDRGREAPELVLVSPLLKPAGPDDWNGHSRAAAKTSYVDAEPEPYVSISSLRQTLPSEAHMLSLNIPWGKGSDKSNRVAEESRNVTVSAYVYAFKKEGDHDYHIIIGDAPDSPNQQFINSEASALVSGSPFRPRLKQVRDAFKSFYGIASSGPADYVDVDPPMPVRITGSLFFDMDHSPPRAYVGHGTFQPETAWEIHPITSIEFEPEP
jgi:hypothetical protein